MEPLSEEDKQKAELFMKRFREICSEFNNTEMSFKATCKKSYEMWSVLDSQFRYNVLHKHYTKEIKKFCQPFTDYQNRFS